MSAPKISVIMQCYNDDMYVREAIESVLNQTYSNFEFWVIDNGSTDSSGEIIDSYADRIDHISHLKTNTANANFNAIQNCNGEYIAVMSSNDVWIEDKLQEQVDVLAEQPDLGAVFTWADICNEELQTILGKNTFMAPNGDREAYIKYLLYQGNHLAYYSSLIETKLFRRLSVVTGFCQLGDYFLWIRLLFEREIYVVQKVLLHVRNLDKSMSAVTLLTQSRTMNEQVYIWLWVFENIPDELFIRIFQLDFIRPEAREHRELICEKIFILEKASSLNMYLELVFLYWYYRYYGECADILEKKYNTDFFSMVDSLGKKGMLFHLKKLEAQENVLLTNLKGQIDELRKQMIGGNNVNGHRVSQDVEDAIVTIRDGYMHLYAIYENMPDVINRKEFVDSFHDIIDSFDTVVNILDGTEYLAISKDEWNTFKEKLKDVISDMQLTELKGMIENTCRLII